MIKTKILLCVIFMSVFTFNSYSETEKRSELISDRPSFTDSPKTMLPGDYRVEAGVYSRESSRDQVEGDEITQTFGQLFLIRGLTTNTEIQLGFESLVTERVKLGENKSFDQGFGNTQLRLKYNVLGNDSKVVGIALIPRLGYTGSLDGSYMDGGLSLPISISLPNDHFLNMMSTWEYAKDDAQNEFVAITTGVVFGRGFGDHLTGFLQYSDERGSHLDYSSKAGVGGAYKVLSNFQLDLTTNFGISSQAPDTELIAGFTYQN